MSEMFNYLLSGGIYRFFSSFGHIFTLSFSLRGISTEILKSSRDSNSFKHNQTLR